MFGTCESNISRILVKHGVKCRKKIKSAKYTDEQVKLIKRQCKILVEKHSTKSFILDDEKYFTLSNSQINGNSNFYTNDVTLTPNEVMYKPKVKFEKKLLFYIAISEKGKSKFKIFPSGMAINQKVYQDECIKKCLIPFIDKYHSDDNYVFWPDKASSHYAKNTINLLNEEFVEFVEKIHNPTNLPQCRPIEDFFGYLSSIVYENGWSAENLSELEKKIRLSIRKIDMEPVYRQFS